MFILVRTDCAGGVVERALVESQAPLRARRAKVEPREKGADCQNWFWDILSQLGESCMR